MRRRGWLVVAIAIGAVVGSLGYAAAARTGEVSCPTAESTIVVDTKQHTLALCADGRAVESFNVRLGKHGTGKSREGDGKTPLGRYPLAGPTPSQSFGLFIPVGYPTLEQRDHGYTGSAIGVHGPGRGVRWLGRLVNTFDLTEGCVGLATDDEMKRIADFVAKQNVREITIR